MRAVFISFFTGLCDPNLSSKPSILTAYKHDSKQVFLLYIFSMVKTFDCSKCGGHHARPINRNCKNIEKEQPMDTNTQILNELKNLSGRMLQMESRMDNISSRTSSPARSLSKVRRVMNLQQELLGLEPKSSVSRRAAWKMTLCYQPWP